MSGEDDLGQRLRAARIERGHSLRATAAATQVSPSLLSQVETGKVHPSVSTLYSVVSFLGISLDEVLGQPAAAAAEQETPLRGGGSAPVLPAGSGIRVVMENGVTWDRLATLGAGGVDPLLTTYAPHGSSSIDDTHMRHSGVEYGYIIQGELTLKLEFESYLLRAGDSVCFDSRRPHLYVNHTNELAQGIWFVVGRSADDATEPVAERIRTAVDVLDLMDRRTHESEGYAGSSQSEEHRG